LASKTVFFQISETRSYHFTHAAVPKNALRHVLLGQINEKNNSFHFLPFFVD